jgi:hypothetical protein
MKFTEHCYCWEMAKSQKVQIFIEFNAIRIFITVFARGCRWSLSWAGKIQSRFVHPIRISGILLFLFHSAPKPNKCISYLKLSYVNFVCFVHFLPLTYVCSITQILHLSRFDHPVESNFFFFTFTTEAAHSDETFFSTKFQHVTN